MKTSLLLTSLTAFFTCCAQSAPVLNETVGHDTGGNLGELKARARVPAWDLIVKELTNRPWATELKQVPATVITTGIFSNVPYISFQCAFAYELNIYGDLQNPAAVEIGFRGLVVESPAAKTNCFALVERLLRRPEDRVTLQKLKWTEDLLKSDGMTFEVTPPTAADSEGGWWISVYDEALVTKSRATAVELEAITQPVASGSVRPAAVAPQTEESRISFTDLTGRRFENVRVRSAPNGLYWFPEGGGGGLLPADRVPTDLRQRFGVDLGKAADYDRAKAVADRRLEAAMEAAAQQENSRPTAQQSYSANWTPGELPYARSVSSRPVNAGGSVYVSGYVRKDGTYVHSYTRHR